LIINVRHVIGIALSRPCATGRGTRARHGWRSFACLDRAMPIAWPVFNYKFTYTMFLSCINLIPSSD